MILWADGFDHYGGTGNEANMTAGAWVEVVGAALSNTQARTGTYSMQFNLGGPDRIRSVFGAAQTTAKMGAAFYLTALPDGNDSLFLFQFNDAANACQVAIMLQSTGAVAAYRGAPYGGGGGVLLSTSSALVSANAWNHIEAKVIIDDSAGAVEVRLNGVTIVNVAGADTKFTANTETSQVQIGHGQNLLQNAPWYVDDVVASNASGSVNTDFLGDRKVYTDFPNADTADVDWTPNSGANRYSRINDATPDGDTSYVSSTAAAQKFGVTFPALDSAVTSIAGIIFVNLSKKTDAGDCSLEVDLVSSGDVEAGAVRAITAAYTLYHDVFQTDPHTSAIWTQAAASAAAMRVTRML